MHLARLLRHALLTFALVLGLVSMGPAPAQAVATGSLSGVVQDPDGEPLGEVYVELYRLVGEDSYDGVGMTVSATDGSYQFTDLDTGAYFLRFEDWGHDRHPGVWSTGAESPQTADQPGVYGVDGGPVEATPVRMPEQRSSSISGRVQSPDGSALDNVLVEAFPEGSGPDAEPVASSITYGGAYDLYVARGSFRVEYSHLSDGWTDAIRTAQVGRNETLELEPVTLEPAESFVSAQGRVIPSSGEAEGLVVSLYRVTGGGDSRERVQVAEALTDAGGDYRFDRLKLGARYTVAVSGRVIETFLGDTDDFWADGTTIFRAQADNSLPAIHALLRPTVRGHVSDQSADGVAEGVRVIAFRYETWGGEMGEFEWEDSTVTDATGDYQLDLWQGGTYAIQVDPGTTDSPGAVTWWGGHRRPSSPDEAGTFTVTLGEPVDVKDIALPTASRISGVVSDSGAPQAPADVEVLAYLWVQGEFGHSWEAVGSANTDEHGRYLLRLDQPGTYTLHFRPDYDSPGRPQWLGGLDEMPATPAEAQIVELGRGQLVEGQDITLADAPVLTGRVLTEAGEPLNRATINATKPTPDGTEYKYVAYTRTDAEGRYQFKVPLSGEVFIKATKRGYYGRWLHGASANTWPAPGQGTPLDGSDLEVADIRLAPKPVATGSLAGTVGSEDGPVADATVQICAEHDGRCVRRTTDSQGAFAVEKLTVGDWRVRVWPASGELFPGGEMVTIYRDHESTVSVTLEAPRPLPGDGSVSVGQGQGSTTASGIPTLFVGDPITLKVEGPGGLTDPKYYIEALDGSWSHEGPMGWENGVYSAVIPANAFQSGEARIRTNIPAGEGEVVEFNVYIDPSGIVIDQFGHLLQDAEASLLRSDTQDGEYSLVPDGSTIMSPSNRTNPMTTGSDARFHWDVTEGWYKVAATHEDCRPGSTEAMEVPPERINLVLQLECDAPEVTTAPRITGTGRVGERLSVTPATWPREFEKRSYQWYADGAPVSSAVSYTGISSYEVSATDIGKEITVTETVQNGDHTPLSVTSQPVEGRKGSAPEMGHRPTITGDPVVGGTLEGGTGSWNTSRDGYSFGFQWTRGGEDIPGATSNRYVPVPADIDQQIALRVSVTHEHYETGSATSEPVEVRPGQAPSVVTRPGITGTPAVGSTLTATPGQWSQPETEHTYQWTRDGQSIPGAEAATYKVAAADAGTRLAVTVTAHRQGYGTGSAEADAVTVRKVASRTLLRMLASKLSARKASTAQVTVTAPGLPVAGRIAVLIDRKRTVYANLVASSRGVVRMVLPRLRKGTHTLQASYAGSPQVAGSTSPVLKVKVRR